MSEQSVTLTQRWIIQLKAALDWAGGDEVPEIHRKAIRRALESTLADAADFAERQEMLANEGSSWKPQEIKALQSFLESLDPASDYHISHNNAEMAAARFKRAPKAVKRKAIELGFGDRLDYWLNLHRQEK